ncbi:MAG: plastocyanin/azurin family copper-binding protein [Planctomycetaceae bacterium]
MLFRTLLAAGFVFVLHASAMAQDHAHHDAASVERPKVFLDKSPKIVEYQLKRLDNARLLLVETATDDAKYAPVFQAILTRPGMARQNRDEALAGLVALHQSDPAGELLTTLSSFDSNDRELQRVAVQLSGMLLEQAPKTLNARHNDLLAAAASENPILQSTGMAALIVAGGADQAWDLAQKNDASRVAWLSAVRLVPTARRSVLRTHVVELLNSATIAVRAQALTSLVVIPAEQAETFQRVASFVSEPELRTAAVRGLLKVADEFRDAATASQLVAVLTQHAEQTPAEKRTTDEFLDAMQLADELLKKLPAGDAKGFRDRLRAVTVRVVRIHTVEEEMRFDQPFFAVEAGRPVQVVLENVDLMPHNFVVTRPGKLKDVALAGAELGTTPGLNGHLYVPESDDVLFSTSLVNAGSRELLTFTAPTEPGEYPYVCTFPRHWMRMYGVMLVVDDLDQWQRNPTQPKDPLGNNRSFVQNWKLQDFPPDQLAQALRGRNSEIGGRLFKEATCLGCHKVKGEGGAVGPELTDVLKRWKGDRYGILREMLEPSYRIEPKYAVKVVVDSDGKTTSGIVTAEDSKSISILVNPEVPEPKVIQKKDIEEIIPSTTSMMPKALLDKFTRDEIMEILNYIATSETAE